MPLPRLSLGRSMALVVVFALAFAWLRFTIESLDNSPTGRSLLGFEEGFLDLAVVGMAATLAAGWVMGLHRHDRGLAFLISGVAIVAAFLLSAWVASDEVAEFLGERILFPISEAYSALIPEAGLENSTVALWGMILLMVAALTVPQLVLALVVAYVAGPVLIRLLGGLVARTEPVVNQAIERHRRLEEIERKLDRVLQEIDDLKHAITERSDARDPGVASSTAPGSIADEPLESPPPPRACPGP